MFCVDIKVADEEKKNVLKELLKRNGYSILHQNVRGLLNNFVAVEELISSNQNIDVLTLSETHISASQSNDKLYTVSGYNFEKRDRKVGKGGGVAVYIKNSVNYVRRTDLESEKLENIVIEIILTTSTNFLITTHYRPPQGSNYLQNNYNELFAQSLELVCTESKEVILLGDLNVDYLKRNDNKDIKSIISDNGFTQVIKSATRITKDTKSLIDIIASNRPGSISASIVFQSSISDHDLVGCVRKVNHQKHAPKTIKCRNYKSYDPTTMNHEFKNVNWLPVITAPDVNTALNIFNTIVRDIFDKHAPIISKRIKGRPCPWIDAKLKEVMNRRDKVLRKARKSRNDEDWSAYKTLRNNCNNLLRNAKANYHKNKIQEGRQNPKQFWKAVKDVFPTKTGSNNMSSSVTQTKNLADSFRDYFATAVNSLKCHSIRLKDFLWKSPVKLRRRTEKTFEFQYVSKVFVKSFLSKLRRKKATGTDELPPGMLKDCREFIVDPLHHIVNLSLQTSTVPTVWKRAKIVPIFKSGDQTQTENYRPISVLPILSKLVEKAVHLQFLKYLEENKLLSDSQYGYRAQRSTQHATTLFVDNIREAAEKGQMVGALFLDLSKAFDTISHDIIINKLQNYGVMKTEIEWFTDYLFNRTQHVAVGNQRSSSFGVMCGVPQGSILGPLLFLVFFDDFEEQLSTSNCIQYADDTVIYVSGKSVELIEQTLNTELEKVFTYLKNNELVLNLKEGKTETMLFGTPVRLAKQTKNTLSVVIEDKPVHHTTSYTYLGIRLDSTLTFSENFDRAYKKAAGRLNLLTKLRCFLNVEAAFKIYDMVIVPIIMYSALISLQLTRTQQTKLKSLDNRAKQVIGGNVKMRPLENRMKTKACTFVKQCLDGNTCDSFKNYFEINKHSLRTRNSNKLLKIPSVKLEFGKKSLRFQGAKIYNSLPLKIRECTNFSEMLNTYFDR